MGEIPQVKLNNTTMIVETNITYNQELKLDDEVDINLIYL